MIKIYRQGHETFSLDNRRVLSKVVRAEHKKSIMEDDSVTIQLKSVSTIEFNYRDYIIYDGRPYFLNVLPKVTKNDDGLFEYELRFEGGIYELSRSFFTMTGMNGWDYSGNLYDFSMLVINDMNRDRLTMVSDSGDVFVYTGVEQDGMYKWYDGGDYYYTALMLPQRGDAIYLDGKVDGIVRELKGAWVLDFDTTPNVTDTKFLTYDCKSCLAVVQDLMAQWEDWEFEVVTGTNDVSYVSGRLLVGGKLIMRLKSNGIPSVYSKGHVLGFGRRGGLKGITRKPIDDANVPSRIYFYGGTQNVPTTYRNTRICLPDKVKMKSYIDMDTDDDSLCEEVKVFDDVYPASEPFTITKAYMRDDKHFTIEIPKSNFFDLYAVWKNPTESPTPKYGSYEEWKKTYGTGDSVNDLRRYNEYYYCAGTKHPKSCYLQGDVTITFQSGNLEGMSFTIHEFSDQDKNNYEITLNCSGVENLLERDILYTPNADLMCFPNDKFIVEGCIMPWNYVYASGSKNDFSAEAMLRDEATKYIEEIEKNVSIEFEISNEYLIRSKVMFRVYDVVKIEDDDMAEDLKEENFRITGITTNILNGLDCKVTIDNSKELRSWAKFKKRINSIIENEK